METLAIRLEWNQNRIETLRVRMEQDTGWNGMETHAHLLRNELVQPAGVNVVTMETVSLQEGNEVLNGGSEVPSYGELLQSQYHVPGGREVLVNHRVLIMQNHLFLGNFLHFQFSLVEILVLYVWSQPTS